MGGLGSGERFSKKQTVESCYWIDTTTLKRWKLLLPGITGHIGAFQWRRGSEEKASVAYDLTVGQSTGTLRLVYGVGNSKEPLDYSVRLVTTPCHLGGVRWWFLCPLSRNGIACNQRVRKLYLRGKYFGCRHCHDLAYRSSQESDSRVYALARAGLSGMRSVEGASVTELGLALKTLDLLEKRSKRFGG